MAEIIAEVAQGYGGDPSLAALLVTGAASANADAVKLQLVLADELAVPSYEYYERYRGLEMSARTWASLVDEAHARGIRFYTDVFGRESLALASSAGVDGVKIHASDFHNTELLERAIGSFGRVYVSVGGASDDEIRDFAGVWADSRGACDVILLYGFQAYPTPIETTNLNRLRRVSGLAPGFALGFMDHVSGESDEALILPAMAMVMGAVVVEKHITLDHALELVDHWSALTVDRFREFVAQMRLLESALGELDGQRNAAEIAYQSAAGKVVVAVKDLAAGTVIEEADIALKRVPMQPECPFVSLEQAVGRRLAASVHAHDAVSDDVLMP